MAVQPLHIGLAIRVLDGVSHPVLSGSSESDSMTNDRDSSLRKEPRLESGQSSWWAVWAVVAAFSTYFCMYAFRKPFTAAEFSGTTTLGLSFKSLLVTSQVIGYAISKFLGIKVISEMRANARARVLLILIAISEIALILFGLTPRPWNALFMFLNGVPLGMVFGLVMGFLEGRRVSEALSAGLCASFILADGATKSVGAWLLKSGVPEDWMPAVAGGLFVAPLLMAVSVLVKTPPPSIRDIEERVERVSMDRDDRWLMMRQFGTGLAAIIMMYLMVTILRSLRADFAAEIWKGLGEPAAPSTFTTSEILVAAGVLVINGCLVLVHSNRVAFRISLLTCLAGFLMIVAALTLRSSGLSAFSFMVLIGLGLYLPYVAVHATVFERLIAMTRSRGNVGFLMYVADSTGYLGYVGCMFYKSLLHQDGNILPFFSAACWITALCSVALVLFSMWYFSASRITLVTEQVHQSNGEQQQHDQKVTGSRL